MWVRHAKEYYICLCEYVSFCYWRLCLLVCECSSLHIPDVSDLHDFKLLIQPLPTMVDNAL